MQNVLITGGTGYLGRGLVAELMKRGTKRICIYSRDEAKQAEMKSSIPDPEQCLHFFVGDVRDRQRLQRAMAGTDTVIHCAALKRVEVGEYNPGEMVKTNVLGTMNVIEAAFDAPLSEEYDWLNLRPHGRLRRVVLVSTDKACQPLNAYGASKLMAEKLILGAHNARGESGPIFSVVRYGNVAGSTGSVIPTWRAAIEAGKRDLYITDPTATRFWMTLQDAVNLVLAEDPEGGRLLVPILPAYQLDHLAIAMGVKLPIEERGLGKGEKLHERMLEDGQDSSQVRRMTIDELKEALKTI